jgi:hypothetical protein
MGLDSDLLRDAKAARARLLEAQHAAERARVDYHHAIRRLHAAGGSLREIAEALRLSHQRVHQIIDEAAEPSRPWWRRRGRRRGPAGPLRLEAPGSQARCSFCGKEARQVGSLVASGLVAAPGGKFGQDARICDECLDLCGKILAEPATS